MISPRGYKTVKNKSELSQILEVLAGISACVQDVYI